MKFKNVEIIGTSHIAQQSLQDVTLNIERHKGGIVAVELDKQRLYGLLHGKRESLRFRDIRYIGLKGFVFAALGAWAEKKLGKLVGVAPGSEMKQAVLLAKKHNMKVALIDQNITVTLKRFSEEFTWKEKGRIVVDIVKSLFNRKTIISFDLRTVPEPRLIKTLVQQVKIRYPSMYRVLIEERNHVMAHKLEKLMYRYPETKILAFVGAGHVEEIISILKQKSTRNEISYSYTLN